MYIVLRLLNDRRVNFLKINMFITLMSNDVQHKIILTVIDSTQRIGWPFNECFMTDLSGIELELLGLFGVTY